MAKINLTVNLDDEKVLDDAAQQAIKGYVRRIVQEDFQRKIADEIRDTVKRYIEQVTEAIKKSGWYSSDVELRKSMHEKIQEKAAELSITTDGLKKMVDDYMKPIAEYVNQKAEALKDKEAEIDKVVSRQIRERVDALFKTTLTTALAEALLKNSGQ